MTGFGDCEMRYREQVVKDAILGAAQAGRTLDDVVDLRSLILGPYKEAFRRGLTGDPPAQDEPGSMQVRFKAAHACTDADYNLPSKSAIKYKQVELVELVGAQTSVRTTF